MNKRFGVFAMGTAVLVLLALPLIAQETHQESKQMPAFVPLRAPRFTPAAEASFLENEDHVVGVSENGISKAYEPSVVAFHHVVQDSFGEMPVIVTWCSLCNTPLVYRSDVDGRKLTFERAGNRGNNFFMVDAETGSHWQQIGGDCFEGPMKGKRLTLVPFLYTTWGEWRTQNPHTLVLIPEPAYKDTYKAMAERIANIAYGSNKKPSRELLRQEDTRLPNYEEVIGIRIRNDYKAYPLPTLRKEPVVNDKVGLTPIVVVFAGKSGTTTAFSRLLNNRILTFHEGSPGTIVDEETRSTWTPYGKCVAGKLKGQKLEIVIPQPGLWFAWAEFHPSTQIYSGAGR